jgi:hypothetical protein
MALAFAAGSVSMAQACPSMTTAKSDQQQLASTDKAPKSQSTPIVIPSKTPKSES